MTYPQNRGWDPFGELQALRSELGRLIGFTGAARGTISGGVDLKPSDSGWVVTAALPGVAPEEVAIDVDDRELCIRARTEAEVNEENGLGSVGSQQRSFEYRVALPAEVNADEVDATMDHGLLTVHLPRTERRPRRTIRIGGRAANGAAAQPPVGNAQPAGGQAPTGAQAPAPGGDQRGPTTPIEGDPAADREMHHDSHHDQDRSSTGA